MMKAIGKEVLASDVLVNHAVACVSNPFPEDAVARAALHFMHRVRLHQL